MHYYAIRGRFLFRLDRSRIQQIIADKSCSFESEFGATMQPKAIVNGLTEERFLRLGCWMADLSRVERIIRYGTSGLSTKDEELINGDRNMIVILFYSSENTAASEHYLRLRAWSSNDAEIWYSMLNRAANAWKSYDTEYKTELSAAISPESSIPQAQGTAVNFILPYVHVAPILWPICTEIGCPGILVKSTYDTTVLILLEMRLASTTAILCKSSSVF